MIRENVKNFYMDSIKSLLSYLELKKEDWEIDISDTCGEGHVYEVEGKWYELESDVTIINKSDRSKLSAWVDVAYVESMPSPILFFKSIWAESSNKYKKIKTPNPNEQIRQELTEEQYKELMKQPYFAKGLHLNLYDTVKEKGTSSTTD